MNKARRLIREHRLTAWMMVFVIIFYSVSLVANANHQMKSQGPSAVTVETADKLNFKQKEDSFKKNVVQRSGLLVSFTSLALLAILAGCVLDIRFLLKLSKGQIAARLIFPHRAVLWTGVNVLTVVVFMFFCESVLLMVETGIFALIGSHDPPRDLLLMANSLLRNVFTAYFIIYFVSRRLGHELSDLGLTLKDFFKNVGRGIVAYIGVLPPLILALMLVAAVSGLFSYNPAPQKVVQIYLKKSSDPYLIYFTLFVAGLGPVIEEIIFRGFAYKTFRQKYGMLGAMLLTSLIFALFHRSLPAFLPVFILGIFLSYLYEKTGSLVPSMTAHMLHNLLMVSFTLGFKSIAG